MGAELTAKLNKCCATNQAMDGDRVTQVNATRTAHKLYPAASVSSTYGEGGYNSTESSWSEEDPAEVAIRFQVTESFKLAIEKGNSSLARYYFNEHPDLQLVKIARWRNGINL